MSATSIDASSLTTWFLRGNGGWDTLLTGAAFIWLTALALYDMRHRAVPHLAWVALPCAAAGLLSVWRGDWPLTLAALIVIALSERGRLPSSWRQPAQAAGGLALAGLLLLMRPDTAPGGMALAGFWLGYELGWWAGADALAAITLALFWPELGLLLAMAVAHLCLGVWQRRKLPRLRALQPPELERFGQPGMPALALTVVIHAALRGLARV